MNQLLRVVEKNEWKVEADREVGKNTYRGPAIALMRILIENQAKHSPEKETCRNIELSDLVRTIEQTSVEIKQWIIQVKRQRSDFSHFHLQNIQMNRKSREGCIDDVSKGRKHSPSTGVSFSCGKLISTIITKNEGAKKLLEDEMELWKIRLERTVETYRRGEKELSDLRLKAKERCLDRLRKYDNDIGSLRDTKTAVLTDKHILEEEYAVVQNEIVTQRILYNRVKEEREENMRKIFLERLANFRENHAAKVIQRTWRSYCARISSKKRKSRKYCA